MKVANFSIIEKNILMQLEIWEIKLRRRRGEAHALKVRKGEIVLQLLSKGSVWRED